MSNVKCPGGSDRIDRFPPQGYCLVAPQPSSLSVTEIAACRVAVLARVNLMSRLLRSWKSPALIPVLLLSLVGQGLAEAPREMASVEQLKSEAFAALRVGQFDRTQELLGQAASRSEDPQLKQMTSWLDQFEEQRRLFAADRHKQYEKAVEDIHTLLDNDLPAQAIDAATRAHLLAEDKEAFRAEPWVEDLVQRAIRMADEAEKSERWVRALRLYSDLSSIEPANPGWKERLKLSTRRLRLLAMYAPDAMKTIQKADEAERLRADALIKPTTQPARVEADEDDDGEGFRTDWRDMLAGVNKNMVKEAIFQARGNYYREVSYRDLMLGGLNGLKVLVSIRELENTFPNLSDPQRRAQFEKTLAEQIDRVSKSIPGQDRRMLDSVLDELDRSNNVTVQLDPTVLFSEFADGALGELDPFTSMIWPSDMPDFLKTTRGEFSGVGIQIQLDDEGNLKVVTPIEDSPAFKAGIKADDIITHIDGKSAKGITLNQAVKHITGPSNTIVVLTVRGPDGVVKEYPIRRKTIEVASIKGWSHKPGGGWDYLLDDQQKVGYVRLTNFTDKTSDELDRAIGEMTRDGARGLILDLRYNPGGLLTAATRVTDRFIREGLIVSTRADRETLNNSPAVHAEVNADVDLPLVVLVNQYSASASEIVSGALKDHKRALIVGERTFGKGSVQMLFPLDARQAILKLTTSHYYLPGGTCIHREENSLEWGVGPDVTIEMTPDQMRAAIDARQDLDVLRAAVETPPADDAQRKLDDAAGAVRDAVTEVVSNREILAADPQLSAALLLLRLQLAGAPL